MSAFARTLRFLAPVILAVALAHLLLGTRAEALLGARLPSEVALDPVLDSQDRFYGVAFAVFGVLLWQCAADLVKYQSILRSMFWVFFAAGCARFVSFFIAGWPGPFITGLWALELLAPPLLLAGLGRVVGKP